MYGFRIIQLQIQSFSLHISSCVCQIQTAIPIISQQVNPWKMSMPEGALSVIFGSALPLISGKTSLWSCSPVHVLWPWATGCDIGLRTLHTSSCPNHSQHRMNERLQKWVWLETMFFGFFCAFILVLKDDSLKVDYL